MDKPDGPITTLLRVIYDKLAVLSQMPDNNLNLVFMVNLYIKQVVFLFTLTICCSSVLAQDFVVLDKNTKASIVYDSKGPKLDSVTAFLLQQDIKRVTGFQPMVLTDLFKISGNVIVIGNVNSAFIRKLLPATSTLNQALKDKWECYGLTILSNPLKNIAKALVIAGSDTRGTAYGVFSISERIGVSPWYWWADVAVKPQTNLIIHTNGFVSVTPSVKYRGIFLNDEDWGLQPWAAKTFEPETGDIGPKTYAKIFELLLRLKANLIWPAMHPSTKAFYHYPGNKKVAEDYAILIGSSHAEPMLRNNVGEWNKDLGAFNYLTNKDKVYNYWEQRVKESSTNEAIYTLGMRGVHDSGMEGIKSVKEAVPLLHQIFNDQRNMLTKYLHKDIKQIPQVFTAYKEVLEIYDANLKLADDVTLVWPDDNYGYIQRLNSEKEVNRPSGSGIYYHASYWGRPHDYLWLSSTHPGLIREEMMKAYATGSDRLWVLNVGDIKPLEYNIQFFLDMAYRAEPFKDSEYSRKHLTNWVEGIFGKEHTKEISNTLWQYYDLAFERKPEFMGWSQTEPTTQTANTGYNHFYYGDEAQRRINSYQGMEATVKNLRPLISSDDSDAYYQLVYYPVVGASLLNKKFLYKDKSVLYAKQNRLSSGYYATKSQEAYAGIIKETAYYNHQLTNGKWNNMMSMQPRDLPVYLKPEFAPLSINKSAVWNLSPEGYIRRDSMLNDAKTGTFTLPEFNQLTGKKYFIDLFLSDEKEVKWTVKTKNKWIKLNQQAGTLQPEEGKNETRLWVSIDWTKVPSKAFQKGEIKFSAAGKTISVQVPVFNNPAVLPADYTGFLEDNGYISMLAKNFTRKTAGAQSQWETIHGLGEVETSLIAMPLDKPVSLTEPVNNLIKNTPVLEYDFITFHEAEADIDLYTLPTHPINTNYSMRFAISIDGGPATLLDYKTIGRSEEWKQNVLRNSAISHVKGPLLKNGKHTLKVYMVDPGVILQRITIDMGGLRKAYSIIPETIKR